MHNLITESMAFLVKNRSLLASIFICFIALSIRLAYLQNTVVQYPISHDAQKYVAYATNIVQHGVYSQDLTKDPKTDTQVTPGYPFFLAGIMSLSRDFKAFYVNLLSIQAIIGALTAVIAYLIGMYVLPFGLAVCAGILTALSPHLITMAGYVLNETLFTFLLSLAIWVLLVASRKEKLSLYLVSSIIIGLASLVRPALLLFPVSVSLLIYFYLKPTRRLLTVFLLLIGVASMILPWGLWANSRKSTEDKKVGLALSSFVFGSYPDLIYKNPSLKGFPYLDDPNYYTMATDLIAAVKTIGHRAADSPVTYAIWYLFGKPSMFWNWEILVGQGDIYVYAVETSLYKTNSYAELTRVVMKYLHPVFILMALVGFVNIIIPFMGYENPFGSRTSEIFLYSLLIYFTLVHTALAPLPRYAIPLRPMLYVGAMIFLGRLLSFKHH